MLQNVSQADKDKNLLSHGTSRIKLGGSGGGTGRKGLDS